MSAENMAYVERLIREVVIGCDTEVFWNRNIGGGPIIGGVIVSDTFAYACADSENIEEHEIDSLVAEVKRDPIYGDTVWAATKRNLRPIDAFLRDEGRHMSDETKAILEALPRPARTTTPRRDETRGET